MLVGFKLRFRTPIENGSKIHTIRNTPKRMPKIGEQLHMYTGLRTKNCMLITKEHTLKSIQKITIDFIYVGYKNTHIPIIYIDSLSAPIICISYKATFYINDGFKDEADFVSFWNLPKKEDATFEGYLFHWTDLKY